jgi:hypothetical protein
MIVKQAGFKSAKEYNFYVPLPYILHLTDSCPFSKEPLFAGGLIQGAIILHKSTDLRAV